MNEPREKYLSPKELADEMNKCGVTISEKYIRDALHAGVPHIATGNRMFAQLSKLLAWLESNHGFSPRGQGGFA